MIGAIAGDIIGSVYEYKSMKSTNFPLFHPQMTFTDDTVLTVAIADALLYKHASRGPGIKASTSTQLYVEKLQQYGRKYPDAGYGQMFHRWIFSSHPKPYHSYGNGSAMRVSPIGFAFDDMKTVLAEAKKSAEVTHNHREGIKGAQAVASAIFLARKGSTKAEIKEYIEKSFDYDLNFRIDDIRLHYSYDISCQGSVPQAIGAFLESDDFEDSIRKAISIGGDSDTIGCINGGIAQAFYKKIPAQIVTRVKELLDAGLKRVIHDFNKEYHVQY